MHAIGEASRLSGVNIETIRYYERSGLLPRPERTASGRRLYDAEGIARLRFVRRGRDLGFSIEDIRALLALSEESGKACGEVRAIGTRHLAEVRGKIADLVALENALGRLIAECDEDRRQCPVLRRLFAD